MEGRRKARIALARFELVDPGLVEEMSVRLEKHYKDMDFDTMPRTLEFPRTKTRHNPAEQYRASDITPYLGKILQSIGFDLIVAFTSRDLYVSGLNFVFGLASPRDRAAVVSLCRLDDSFYGSPSRPSLLLRRTLVEAVHELGHLLGLPHCSDPRCVMFFSNSILDTDAKSYLMCINCRRKLEYRR